MPWRSIRSINSIASRLPNDDAHLAAALRSAGAQALEFYKAAFGAVEKFRVDAPDGSIVATLAVKGAEFWVAEESKEHQNFSPETLKGGTVRMILTIDEPDGAFDRAAPPAPG